MERIKALNREGDEDEAIDPGPTTETIIEVFKCFLILKADARIVQ